MSMQSTYTGVYSRGGPTNVDPSKDLSSLLDRSDADVRGVKKRGSSGSGDSTARSGSVTRQGSLLSQPYNNYRTMNTMTDILATGRSNRPDYPSGLLLPPPPVPVMQNHGICSPAVCAEIGPPSRSWHCRSMSLSNPYPKFLYGTCRKFCFQCPSLIT